MVDRFIPGVLKKTALKQIIDAQTIKWHEARIEERRAAGKIDRSLYASDYGQCMRKVYYQFFPGEYFVGEYDARVLRIFHNGEAVHERLSFYLGADSSLQFREEVDVPRDSVKVHGRCDGVCLIDRKFVVTEFKSINSASVPSPKPEHLGQLMWYMGMWNLRRNELCKQFNLASNDSFLSADSILTDNNISDVDVMLLMSDSIDGELIYESKQNNETFHFAIEFDEQVFARVRSWFEELAVHLETSAVPPILHRKSVFPCSWGRPGTISHGQCPYFNNCHT